MSEWRTLVQEANAQRWCMADVPLGQENWAHGKMAWHPFRGKCKGRGSKKINGEWRCQRHLLVEAA